MWLLVVYTPALTPQCCPSQLVMFIMIYLDGYVIGITTRASLSPLPHGYMGQLVCVIYYSLEHWLSCYPIMHNFVLSYRNCDGAGAAPILCPLISHQSSPPCPCCGKGTGIATAPLASTWFQLGPVDWAICLAKAPISLLPSYMTRYDMCVCVTFCNLT